MIFVSLLGDYTPCIGDSANYAIVNCLSRTTFLYSCTVLTTMIIVCASLYYAIATYLSDCHPVYKLLKPHFHYTISINKGGREKSINVGGPIDQVFPLEERENMN